MTCRTYKDKEPVKYRDGNDRNIWMTFYWSIHGESEWSECLPINVSFDNAFTIPYRSHDIQSTVTPALVISIHIHCIYAYLCKGVCPSILSFTFTSAPHDPTSHSITLSWQPSQAKNRGARPSYYVILILISIQRLIVLFENKNCTI